MTPKKMKKKNAAKTKKISGKKSALKKKVRKKAAKKSGSKKKAAPMKKATRAKKRIRGKSQTVATTSFEPKGLGARSGGQSGDLQGLSNRARVDSESVDELLEEGNAFEAEVVEGVEDAPDADQGEVRTHEIPEDDVPDEYNDQ